MTAHAAPITLSILFALACSRPPTVEADTTSGGVPQAADTSGLTCWAITVDDAGVEWADKVPCNNPRPRPPEAVPVTGICCTTPSGPCWAVDLAGQCETPNWFYPCVAGYETVDGNGQPTVVCLDNATG